MKQLRIKTTTSAALFGIFSGGFLSSCAAEKEKDDNEVSKESGKAKPLPPGNKMRYYDEKIGKYWWYEKQSGESYWEKVDFNPPSAALDQWDDDWDNLQHKANKNNAVHQIVLIRHGQYDTSTKHDEKRVLTDLGVKQAIACGKQLKRLIDGGILKPIDRIFYSTMTRATQTYNLIYPSLPPMPPHKSLPCSMIREGTVAKTIPEFSSWAKHGGPSDESVTLVGSRVEAAFKNYFHRAPESAEKSYSTVLVCHGNVIRYFVARALQLPPTSWSRYSLAHTGVVVLEIYPSGKVALLLGDTGHCEPEMITHS